MTWQGETSELLSLKHLKKKFLHHKNIYVYLWQTKRMWAHLKKKAVGNKWNSCCRKSVEKRGRVPPEVHEFEWRHYFLWDCGLPLAYPMLDVFKTCKSLKHRIKITVDIIEEEVKQQKSYRLDEAHIRYILLDRRAWSLMPLVQVKFGRPKSLWNYFCNICKY